MRPRRVWCELPKKRIHRVTVYLLDNDRKRILLQLGKEAPFASTYIPLSTTINEYETPVETAHKLVLERTHLDCIFLGHNPAMPLVLDEISVKIFPPLHVQVINVDEERDYVDYVYLGQVMATPEFRDGGPICWFNQSNLKNSPNHVKHIVRFILSLMN